jgi:predicted transcriptional regulator
LLPWTWDGLLSRASWRLAIPKYSLGRSPFHSDAVAEPLHVCGALLLRVSASQLILGTLDGECRLRCRFSYNFSYLVCMDTKARVRELLDRLPDDCTIEDVQYHLYVLDKIDHGLADIEAGRRISHEDVADRLRKKWLLGVSE